MYRKLRRLKWGPSAEWMKISTIDMHTGGEPLRILMDGYPEIKGTVRKLCGKLVGADGFGNVGIQNHHVRVFFSQRKYGFGKGCPGRQTLCLFKKIIRIQQFDNFGTDMSIG